MLTRTRRNPISFYTQTATTYEPDIIGNWIATSDRDMPWNTIGKALEGSAGTGSIVDHRMTAQEVLAATGLDIDVLKVPVSDPATGLVIPHLFATCYDDDKTGRHYFGAVADRYEVVRPSKGLAFFDNVVSATDGAHYSAVWSMYEKAQMGVTIEFPETIVVDPGGVHDESGLYLLGGMSHDGSTGVWGMVSAVRFWCMNQFSPTVRFGGTKVRRGFSYKHTAGVSKKMHDARVALGITLDWAKAFDGIANQLHGITMTDRQFERFVSATPRFDLKGNETALVEDRIKERRDEVLCAWRAKHNEGITRTRWGAFNVLSEYADWGRTVHGSKRFGTTAVEQRAVGILDSWPVQFKGQLLERLAA